MLNFLWNLYQQGQISDLQDRSAYAPPTTPAGENKELEFALGRIALTNQALWEILSAKLGVTEKELVDKMHEIDLRDGVQDGRVSNLTSKRLCACPSCRRSQNARYARCIYCGAHLAKRPPASHAPTGPKTAPADLRPSPIKGRGPTGPA